MEADQLCKGWVYVIGNRSMPGLWKIGFTEKTPEKRAEELNHTGSPFPYEVAYKIETNNPRSIELKAHRHLASKREGKEWFRCSIEESIAAIKLVAEGQIITEIYVHAERERAESLYAVERKRQKEEQARAGPYAI